MKSAAVTLIRQMEAELPPIQVTPAVTDSLTHGIERLESLLGAERVAFSRVRPLDWEARTYRGLVGRGVTLADAVYDLLAVLQA